MNHINTDINTMIYNITMNIKNIDKNTTTYIDTDNKTMKKTKL